MVAPTRQLQPLITEIARLAAHVFERQIGPLTGEECDRTRHEVLLEYERRVLYLLYAIATCEKLRLFAADDRCGLCGAADRVGIGHRARSANYRAHEWLQLLASIGVDDVRIRGAQSGDELKAENRGLSPSGPIITCLDFLPAAISCGFPAAHFRVAIGQH